jgi:cytochrome P450 family 135
LTTVQLNEARSGLPPGPEAPTAPGTMRFQRDPLGVLEDCRRTYGDVFTLRLSFAGEVVVVTDPDGVAELLDADPKRARAGEGRRAVLPMASPRSVFGGDDEVHRTGHARLAAIFSAEVMQERQEEMVEIAERHLAAWPRGRPFQLLSRMRTLVDDVFVRVMLGIEDEPRAMATVDALGTMLRTPGNPPLPPPGREEGMLGVAVSKLFEHRRAPLRRALVGEIESRPQGGRGNGDVIDCLLGAEPRPSLEEMLDEIVTLLMAAQEPPSIAVTWTLEGLSRHPGLAEDYLRAGEGSALRDAVFHETLRLRPSALAVLRRLREPMGIGDHRLPAGINTMVPLPLIHRDPRFFGRPESFQPLRWLFAEALSPFYLPFGGGSRRCLGEALARAEARAIVPTVLRRLRLRPLWPRRERMVLRGTVLVPHRSVPVLATARALESTPVPAPPSK